VIAYTGHMIGPRFSADNEGKVAAAIRAQMGKERVGCGFGSLAGGADILFAEALIERGAELNVVLPFAREDFIAQSVQPSGPAWPDRFERCLSKAHTVRYATNESYLGDDASFEYAARIAMGHALLRSRQMDSTPALFAVWDAERPTELQKTAGTLADLWLWHSLGHKSWIVMPDGSPIDRPGLGTYRAPDETSDRAINGAILFADVQGFGQLRESNLAGYVDAILAPVARLLDAHGNHVLTRNSWGDAIFAVFDDVAVAAQFAFVIQQTIGAIDRAALELPIDLSMRVAGHFGPIRQIFDPIQGRRTYMGIRVVQAARIEPVTEPGMIYVTGEFAAALALTSSAIFACDYLGEVETAKGYGRLPLYALRAAPLAD
jgi:class 3 adenylate cyclase